MNVTEALQAMAATRLHENQWDAIRQKVQAVLPDILRYDRYNRFGGATVAMNDAAKAESPHALHAAAKKIADAGADFEHLPDDIRQVVDEIEAFGARSILSRRQADSTAGGLKQIAFEILGVFGDIGDDNVAGQSADRKDILGALDDYFRKEDLVKGLKHLVAQGYLKAELDGRGRARGYEITGKGVRWHRNRTSRALTQRMRASGRDTQAVQAAQNKRAAGFQKHDKRWPIDEPGEPAGAVSGGMTTTPPEKSAARNYADALNAGKSVAATLRDKLAAQFPDAEWDIGYTGGEFYARGKFEDPEMFELALETVPTPDDSDPEFDAKTLTLKVFSGQTSGNP